MRDEDRHTRGKQIDKLMKNLRRANQLNCLRNKSGYIVTDPDKIAPTLQ